MCRHIEEEIVPTVGLPTLGYRKRKKGEDRISRKMWELIEKRRGVKGRLIAGNDDRVVVLRGIQKHTQGSEKECEQNKAKYVDSKAEEAENVARRAT